MSKKMITLIILSITFAFCCHWWHKDPFERHNVTNKAPEETDENTRPCEEGEPIDMFSGAFLYQNRDLFIPGHIPLSISRNYCSRRYYNSPFGFGWTINYDMGLIEFSDGKILVRDWNGYRHIFTPSGGGYDPPAGLNAYLTKSDSNYVFKEKHGTQYIFDTLGYLKTIKDRNGNKLSLTYTAQAESIMGYHQYTDVYGVVARRKLLTQVSDDFNRTLNFYYDSNNRIDSIIGPASYKIDYAVNDTGDLTEVIEDAGDLNRKMQYKYDDNHCIDTIVNYNGIAFLAMEYDTIDRVTDQTWGSGEFDISFNDQDSTTTLTDPLTNVTKFAFNSKMLPDWIRNALGDTTKFEYNSNYDLTKITDAKDNDTKFDYNFGNLTKVIDALAETTLVSYTSNFNFIDSIVDPSGNKTKFHYDSNGNLDTIINALGNKTSFTYDGKGNLTKITDPEGHVVNYSYLVSDGLSHNSTLYGSTTIDSVYPTKIWTTVNGRTIAIKFDYDYCRGLRVATSDPNDNITYYDYDSSNRLTKVYYSDNSPNTNHTNTPSMAYTYDSTGNLIKKEDYYGRYTDFVYNDTMDNLIEVKEHLGDSTYTTEYTYDKNNNLTCFENALGHKTYYFYDALSRLKRVMYPDTTPSDTSNNPCYTYLYNNSNDPINLYKRIDANDDTTIYLYDALNRLDSLDYPGSNYVKYKYNEDYTLGEMKDSTGTIKFFYDAAHQIDSISYPNGAFLKISYYDNGLRKQEIFNNGDNDTFNIFFEYDSLNRLAKVIDKSINDTIIYTYDVNSATSDTSLGNLVKISYPNNVVTEYEYSSCCGKVAQIMTRNTSTGDTLQVFEYAYDTTGNIETMYFIDDSEINFKYDSLDRLVYAIKTDTTDDTLWIRDYTYDKVGNVTQLDWRDGQDSGTYYYYYFTGTNILKEARGYTYQYDDNGNPTSCSDGRAFSYDYENRLVRHIHSGDTIDFYYNGFGDRIRKNYKTSSKGQGGSPWIIDEIKSRIGPETYNDLTYRNPMGDSIHDQARDIGIVKFTSTQDLLICEIDHKYLYGSYQGQYENLYITLDIDQVYRKGNLELPDSMMTCVSPAAAWEYCIYIYDDNNYGYFNHHGKRYEKPSGMKIEYQGIGADKKIKLEFPKKFVGDINRIRFNVVTTKPGFVNPNSAKNMMSRATDVYPGGRRVLVNSGVINGYGIFTIGARGKWLKGGGGGSTTDHNYWYNDVGQQICEKEIGAATVYRYYLHGYGLLSRKEGSLGTPEYLHTDMLGSITAITDNSGNEVATYAYDPFGDLLTSAQYLGNWALTGQELDSETDLYHFPARYYEPKWGRFLTSDPWTGMPDDERNLVVQHYVPRTPDVYSSIAMPQYPGEPTSIDKHNVATLDFYPYVANNPMNYLDQYGLWFPRKGCKSAKQCYENCINSIEVKETQRLLGSIPPTPWIKSALFTVISSPILIYTPGLLEDLAGRAAERNMTFKLWDFGPYYAGLAPLLLKCAFIVKIAGLLGTVASTPTIAYLFSTDQANAYCFISCYLTIPVGK